MTPADVDSGLTARDEDSARERVFALLDKNWAGNRVRPAHQIRRAVKHAIAEARRRRPS